MRKLQAFCYLVTLFACVVILGTWLLPSAIAERALPSPVIQAAISGGGIGGASNLTTAGAVPYVSASGVLNQDQTAAHQFFWDATNHRQGIGTATPTYALTLSGPGGGAQATSGTIALVGTSNTGGVQSGVLRFFGSTGKDYGMQEGGSSELYIRDNSRGVNILSFDSAAGNLTLPAANLIETAPTTPASAAAAGTIGTIAWDTGFIYICTATNTWKRVAIATW